LNERESGETSVRYYGRITATILILTAFFFEIVHYFLVEGRLYSPITLLAVIPFTYLGWWLGERYDEVRYAAIHDEPTHAYNRTYAMERFPRMAARASRKKETIKLLLVDVHNIRQIHDAYGRHAGDVVLRNIANTLNRLNDGACSVFRWGGDTFLVLVPVKRRGDVHEDIPATDGVGDLMRELSAKMKKPIVVTVGEAVYPKDGQTLDGLVRHAEQTMHRTEQPVYRAEQTMYLAKPQAQTRVIS
jgi:diguanylate cyclase (GGDEF)-like protein